MKPKLISMCGYPCSGKTGISEYIQKEYNFLRLSTDELRPMLIGISFSDILADPNLKEKDQIVFDTIYFLKDLYLLNGYDVITDCTLPYKEGRQQMAATRTDADKYLIRLVVERDEILRRNKAKSRDGNSLSHWDDEWEEPEDDEGFRILRYENNTDQDMEKIKNELNRILSY